MSSEIPHHYLLRKNTSFMGVSEEKLFSRNFKKLISEVKILAKKKKQQKMSLLFFVFILSFKTDLKQKIMFLMFLWTELTLIKEIFEYKISECRHTFDTRDGKAVPTWETVFANITQKMVIRYYSRYWILKNLVVSLLSIYVGGFWLHRDKKFYQKEIWKLPKRLYSQKEISHNLRGHDTLSSSAVLGSLPHVRLIPSGTLLDGPYQM